ncbi:copper-binding protein [Oceanobacillus piezotolerans]|uniref:Copper-binding protein n=1 Tax=Oceanobacillus piezotolerans TaxID=2448030 RepID=A0A498D971_9BACI|nr:cation transporter [Oceanobacillus piezotolerans]RLL47106.1 copper-binding protein [Oceanobacillus piezotolerans]
MSVEGALNRLDGVSAAEVNLEAGKVDVTFDESKVTVDAMKEAIEEQGYDVEA